MNPLKKYTILFADDDVEYNKTFSKTLSYFCNQVLTAFDGDEAFEIFSSNSCDMVILDLQMPKLGGLEVAKKIREINKEVPIFIVTNYQDFESAKNGYKYNLVDYLVKPVTFDILLQALQKCEKILSHLNNSIIQLDDNCFYDKSIKTVTTNKIDIKLSNAESIVLEHLLSKKGTLITLEEFESLFSNNEQSITSLRNIIYKLRQKLPKEIIKNFAKIGYLIK